MRDPARGYLPSVRTPVEALYWGSAIVAGVILGLDLLAWPIDFIVLVAIGIGATVLRRRVEGRNDPRTSWLWALLWVIVWLPLAVIRHAWPFGSG